MQDTTVFRAGSAHSPPAGFEPRRLRSALVSTGVNTLHSIGAFSLVGRMARRQRSLLILAYHGVSLDDEHEWRPDLYISPERFRRRLTCLRDSGSSVLPLEEALTRLHAGSLPSRSVAITFDDGFFDFSQRALPVLQEFGYPATVYLTTHYSKYRLPIYNLILDYLLWKSGQQTLLLPEFGVAAPLSIATGSGRQHAVEQIRAWIQARGLDTKGKDQVSEALARHLGLDYAELVQSRLLQIMAPSEVQSIARAGVDIQLHTHRHRMPDDRASFETEIEENRRQITELTGKNPVHFCYPSGQYSATSAGWLKELKVDSATTCRHGMAFPDSGLFRLPRVLDDSLQTEARFHAVLNGVVF